MRKAYAYVPVVLGFVALLVILVVPNARAEVSYDRLPFKDVLPLPEGPIEVRGQVRPIRLGFAQTGFNHPWRVAMIESARAEVARHPNVQLIVTDGQVDIMKQTSDVYDLIAQRVDAIILSPMESTALVPAARRVMEAGIPLIVLDRDVFTNKTLFIGQDNYKIAKQLAEYLVQLLNGRGQIVEIQGVMGSSAAIDRSRGFRDVIAKYPGIKILAWGDGQFLREPAMALMEDWLVRFPRIDAVYSHAEESAWGAVMAIKRAGREGDRILQITIDASNEGIKAVKEGVFTADGNYTPFIGDVGVRAALYALMGKDLVGKVQYEHGYKLELPELPIITRENVDQWIGKGW